MVPAVLAASALSAAQVVTWSDADLLEQQKLIVARRRVLDLDAAVVAGEIHRRSQRTPGDGGLAVREGARSSEDLLQRLTGSTGREVRSLIAVGTLLGESGAQDAEGSRPWLDPVVEAVTSGHLGVASAEAIQVGLGAPSDGVDSAVLSGIARDLVDEAAAIGADQLAARARAQRDAADEAGVAAREAQRRAQRYLKLYPQPDGMTKIVGLLDPESAALVTDAFDRVTSPRRHGPRFVQSREVAREQAILADPRTTPQLVHDAFVEMIALAGRADDGAIFGVRGPAVRVHVRGEALARRSGRGRIEGVSDAVSIQTVERLACDTGVVPIGFDTDGQVVNVGREHRLFTARQRVGLAARDGGCRFPGCDRPPSWTEAHHIDEFARDHGKTDIADGVLLCRFHHMRVHNDGWRIVREKADYFAVPPPRPGRIGERLPMPSRNPLL